MLFHDSAQACMGGGRVALHRRPVALDAHRLSVRRGDLGCDRGAAEALDADPTARRVAVYFGTEADARQFAEQAALPSEV